MNEIKIKKVENGYILETPGETEGFVLEVFNTDDFLEVKNKQQFCALLWTITSYFDESGSKYDKERISITVRDQETDEEIV